MPPRRTDLSGILRSHHLRHHPTEAETLLWKWLRSHQLAGIHVRRQHAIGPYIVDFCAPRQKLVIEVDGGQHVEQEAYDEKRTEYLRQKGYRVLRFWNNEVLEHLNEVMGVIWEALNKTS